MLRVEITESVVMNLDDPEPVAVLDSLTDLGVRLVMDDFGTGYSNLAALRRLRGTSSSWPGPSCRAPAAASPGRPPTSGS